MVLPCLLAVLGCSERPAPEPAPQPHPAPAAEPAPAPEPSEPRPLQWPTALWCPGDAEVTEGPAESLHPEYWAVMPWCRLHIGLDFRKAPTPAYPDGYPHTPMPAGSRHRWCPPGPDGSQVYEMLTRVASMDTSVPWLIQGTLVDGKPHGHFQLVYPHFDSAWAIQGGGEFREGRATGEWQWTGREQRFCPTARGQMVDGVPVGTWHTEFRGGGVGAEFFVGTWSDDGWSGEYVLDDGRVHRKKSVQNSLFTTAEFTVEPRD